MDTATALAAVVADLETSGLYKEIHLGWPSTLNGGGTVAIVTARRTQLEKLSRGNYNVLSEIEILLLAKRGGSDPTAELAMAALVHPTSRRLKAIEGYDIQSEALNNGRLLDGTAYRAARMQVKFDDFYED